MPAKSKREAVKQLFYWQYGERGFGRSPDNFSSILFMMFQKADVANKRALAFGFPHEFEAYMEWDLSVTQDDFFKRYGADLDTMDVNQCMGVLSEGE